MLFRSDRWPSGFAGGLVTRNPRWRARHLRMTLQDLPVGPERRLLGHYRVSLGHDGRLLDYCLADSGQWKAYLEIAGEDPWYNNQTYVNTLDKLAIDEFCKLTHEQYARHVGSDFGMTIPAIFTDEPMFTKKTNLAFAGGSGDIVMPWTDDLPETFQTAYGGDILRGLPEIIWNLPEEIGRASCRERV